MELKHGSISADDHVQEHPEVWTSRMTPQEAIAAPRFNHIEGTKVGLEPEFAPDVKEELRRRGHQIVGGNPESFGGAHAIVIDTAFGAFVGGSDPRKGGCALGF